VSRSLTERSAPPGGSCAAGEGALAAMAEADGGNDMMSQRTGVMQWLLLVAVVGGERNECSSAVNV